MVLENSHNVVLYKILYICDEVDEIFSLFCFHMLATSLKNSSASRTKTSYCIYHTLALFPNSCACWLFFLPLQTEIFLIRSFYQVTRRTSVFVFHVSNLTLADTNLLSYLVVGFDRRCMRQHVWPVLLICLSNCQCNLPNFLSHVIF